LHYDLDLLGVACPLNYVRTKIALEKLEPGQILRVRLDLGEPLESVCNSLEADGFKIIEKIISEDKFAFIKACK
jgi:TusA-related sulfurtransferase